MSTLATLKSAIEDDLARSDLSSQIASEINQAIKFYQKEPFYFNETREKTFSTVQDQTWYAVDDDADIGLIRDLHEIIIETSTYDRRLRNIGAAQLEILTDANASSAEPMRWTYYNQKVGLYPTPDAAYTMRMFGIFAVAAPASDDEADNPWMVEAFDLIRLRALARLHLFKLHDPNKAALFRDVEGEELQRIRQETGQRWSVGKVCVPYL